MEHDAQVFELVLKTRWNIEYFRNEKEKQSSLLAPK